jgi:hypothetical protein
MKHFCIFSVKDLATVHDFDAFIHLFSMYPCIGATQDMEIVNFAMFIENYISLIDTITYIKKT